MMRPRLQHRFGIDREPRCPVCQHPITTHRARTQKTCESWRCRAEYRAQQREKRREEDRRFQEFHAQRLAAALAAREVQSAEEDVPDPESYPVLVIPANRRHLVPLPDERRRQFELQLEELVEEARVSPAREEDNAKPEEDEAHTNLLPAFRHLRHLYGPLLPEWGNPRLSPRGYTCPVLANPSGI